MIKTDVIFLIFPAFLSLMLWEYSYVFCKHKYTKIIFTAVATILALGVYIPTLFWITNPKTSTSEIVVEDMNRKPIEKAIVIIRYHYVIAGLPGGQTKLYGEEACVTDSSGIAKVTRIIKPIQFVIFPFFFIKNSKAGFLLYKDGFCLKSEIFDPSCKKVKTSMEKASNYKAMISSIKKIQYLRINCSIARDNKSLKTAYIYILTSILGILRNNKNELNEPLERYFSFCLSELKACGGE